MKINLEELSDLEEEPKLNRTKRRDYSKRGRKDIKAEGGYLSPEQVYERFLASEPRANTRRKLKNLRMARALVAALYVTDLRISELLSIDKSQVTEDNEVIEFKDVLITKRKDPEPFYRDKPLPKIGPMAPFSKIVKTYLDTVEEGKIFPLKRRAAWDWIHKYTGLWPHYFRHQQTSYLVNNRKMSPLAIQTITGHKDLRSISGYVIPTNWRVFKDELLK